jgi:hypothetical protein
VVQEDEAARPLRGPEIGDAGQGDFDGGFVSRGVEHPSARWFEEKGSIRPPLLDYLTTGPIP